MYSILITPLAPGHSKTSWRWRNDPRIWEFTGNKPSFDITPEIERAWIERVLEDTDSRRFAITVDGLYIGNIQLTDIKHREAQYHIFIGDKDYWGGGIAFCASQQIIRFAKNVLGLDKLYLEVNPNHERAIKLYERLGFAIISNQMRMELALNEPSKPMVSIFCLVYNHEFFLRECLDGFIMQKCSFDFEIVVGEDSSTDFSRNILLEYARNYPGKFKLILHDKNIGALANQQCVLENCSGKYIAICEGDDYWTDPLKLQKQIEILEKNTSISCVTHNVTVFQNEREERKWLIEFDNVELNTQNILFHQAHNFLPTGSYVFRRDMVDFRNFELLKFVSFGDWPLIFQLSLKGKIFHMGECLGAYRKHDGGYTSLNEGKMHLRINNFYHAVGILYPHLWQDCKEKIEKLEKIIVDDKEKELKSEESIIRNNGVKKLLRIFIKRLRMSLISRFSQKLIESKR